jgi:hypothetical protein
MASKMYFTQQLLGRFIFETHDHFIQRSYLHKMLKAVALSQEMHQHYSVNIHVLKSSFMIVCYYAGMEHLDRNLFLSSGLWTGERI